LRILLESYLEANSRRPCTFARLAAASAATEIPKKEVSKAMQPNIKFPAERFIDSSTQ